MNKSDIYIKSVCDSCGDNCVQEKENKSRYYLISDPVITITAEEKPKTIEMIEMRPGAVGFLIDIPKGKEVTTTFDCDNGPVEIGVCLEGDIEYRYENEQMKNKSHWVRKSQSFICRLSDCSGTGIKQAASAMKMICVSIDPAVFKMYVEDCIGEVKPEYEELLEISSPSYFVEIMQSTPAMENIAGSILCCKFSESERRMYVTGKLKDLVSLMITEVIIRKDEKKSRVLQCGDSEKINAAKDIILNNIINPPALTEIAKLAGINEFKLKAGFKEIFGTTVFGFIQKERAERAKIMLESGSCTVSETAWNVGYTNVSHFISVFRNHHGINPGDFLNEIKTKIPACKI